jgi:hypothetical protein
MPALPFGRARYSWVRELSQTDLVTCRVWLKANFAKLAAVVPKLIIVQPRIRCFTPCALASSFSKSILANAL